MTSMRVGPFELETMRIGNGRPILLIHGTNPDQSAARSFSGQTGLAAHVEVIAPSHPGFGGSPLPADFDTMYDLVNLYLAILDSLPSDDVTVIGFSFGGWIAAELAVANPEASWPVLILGRPGRHQARGPRGTRHRAFLQYRS